ncbi:hypothetical protein FHL15_009203 [Xylaria flabelliformis]|uniref:Succinate dehydrogenase cytochrome b subunit n=1 Tax=Xylaria flabelliformis TaxID=2512241 RepID=A0A553HPQ6_9PEZI|nr:hypothetical protein FHL15_009203 [Xylaria flabelliformis]
MPSMALRDVQVEQNVTSPNAPDYLKKRKEEGKKQRRIHDGVFNIVTNSKRAASHSATTHLEVSRHSQGRSDKPAKMNVQRVGVRALQQVSRPNAFTQTVPRLMLASLQTRSVPRISPPPSTNSLQINNQSSPVSTEKVTPTEAQSLLASQRLHRPVAPHLSAYDYKQTWFSSSVWTRITGGGFTAALYVFSISYLAAPLTGWHLETASLAAAAGGLPLAVKGGLKFLLAWPFTFHLFNGTRHLVWDLAKGFNKPTIHAGNWGIWGASLVSALGITYFL